MMATFLEKKDSQGQIEEDEKINHTLESLIEDTRPPEYMEHKSIVTMRRINEFMKQFAKEKVLDFIDDEEEEDRLSLQALEYFLITTHFAVTG